MARTRQYLNPKASSRVNKARSADIKGMSSKELSSYIAQEGKRLNQQIVEIERRGLQTASFAYERLTSKPTYALYLGVSKSGRTKINLNTRGMSRSEKQQLAGVIRKFSQAKTMTKSGIESYNRKVLNSLRASYSGMSRLSDAQLADILKTTGFAHIKGTVGSDVVMKMIAQAADYEAMKDFLEAAGTLQTVDGAISRYNEINSEYSGEFEPLPAGAFTPWSKSKK